jgi:hypothetical protein
MTNIALLRGMLIAGSVAAAEFHGKNDFKDISE